MLKTILLSKLFLLLIQINGFSCASNSAVITNVYNAGKHLEGPTWSFTENSLYWIDTLLQRVFRLDGESGNVTTRDITYGPVSLVINVKDNPKLVVVTVRSEVYLMSWDSYVDDRSLRLISIVDVNLPQNRINDGKVDALGRLWFGTMGNLTQDVIDPDQGSLYLLNQHSYWNPIIKVRPVSLSNGIAWSSDNKYMFYVDSPLKTIDYFTFDLESASIRNRTTLFSFAANNITGFPDGMTIDTDNNLWVACYSAGQVIKIDSKTGNLLDKYTLPVTRVTSVMWGGQNLSTLYVTTSQMSLSAAELAEQPQAGSLFAIDGTGSRGYPQNQFIFPDVDKYIR